MATKTYKPTSPGIRFQSHPSFEGLTKKKPERSLTTGKPKTGGRNSAGRITSRCDGIFDAGIRFSFRPLMHLRFEALFHNNLHHRCTVGSSMRARGS